MVHQCMARRMMTICLRELNENMENNSMCNREGWCLVADSNREKETLVIIRCIPETLSATEIDGTFDLTTQPKLDKRKLMS